MKISRDFDDTEKTYLSSGCGIFTKNVIFFYTFPAFLQALPEFNEAQLLT